MENSEVSSTAIAPDENFRVIYRGQLLPGAITISVSAALESRFSMSDKQIAAFYSGRKFVVKKDLSRQRAIRLRNNLREIGLDVVANSASIVAPKRQKVSLSQAKPEDSKNHSNQTKAQSFERAAAYIPTPTPISAKDNSRWIILGFGVIFTLGVIWVFFSI